ncbi:hypothetical protein BDY19DRAFT_909533 [Irpex rosettiformis]|uniref:Uncharacterized protein n=1 Tax=Irpex rosettiformis TaxID=378272 RepID=A0ACB8TSF2_9APHY|nr:hypothetical protein BDY19DRAFT_909533 [Irpex rosettiformis]
MSNNTIYQTSPAHGRPPFGDNMRAEQHSGNPNATSDHGALGNAMLIGDLSDDDDDDEDPFADGHRTPTQRQQPIPLAAPKPGYAAPVAALNLTSPTTPSPSASPVGRQPSPSQGPRPLMLVNNMNGGGSVPNSPRMPSPGISVPNTPHPLPPTITPIQPAFVRPNKADDRDIKFAPTTPILRGEKEETLLPRRGERGDDFWRRFSMVVKQERMLPQTQKESAWLRKTKNGSTRLSRWVWIIGLALLIVIIAAIALGVYVSSKNQTHNAPTAFGGSANEGLSTGTDTVHASVTNGGAIEHSSSRHVSPTATVARRGDDNMPEVTALPPSPVLIHERSSFEDTNVVRAIPPSRHRRAYHNRSEA